MTPSCCSRGLLRVGDTQLLQLRVDDGAVQVDLGKRQRTITLSFHNTRVARVEHKETKCSVQSKPFNGSSPSAPSLAARQTVEWLGNGVSS